jgi:hypothetical protein
MLLLAHLLLIFISTTTTITPPPLLPFDTTQSHQIIHRLNGTVRTTDKPSPRVTSLLESKTNASPVVFHNTMGPAKEHPPTRHGAVVLFVRWYVPGRVVLDGRHDVGFPMLIDGTNTTLSSL